MKKMLAILMLLQVTAVANAFEYSSDHDDRKNYEREREEWYESENRHQRDAAPRYQQNYQPPIQIYLAPNQNSISREDRHHRRHADDRQYREERYWRERREELQQMPQTPYYENQFYRDDTHW